MLDSYRDLIDGLLATPSALRLALGDPVPESVSPAVLQLLVELRARELVMLRRARSIMRAESAALRDVMDEPELKAAHAGEATEATPEELIAGFNTDRSELVSLLMNVTIREWERPVDHHVNGETTLAEEIDDHLTWDEDVIARIRAAA
ncbi:MAG TPA: hypothetical protein VFQ54_09050 [Thermomicrobiales bacterium]|nr:hypothetical protein [Thermomicrobiales bacterium]